MPYCQKVKLLHIKRRVYEFPSFFKPSAQWYQYQTFWVCQVNEKALSLPWMRSKPSRRAVSESLLFIRMSFFYYDCCLLCIRVVFPTLGIETFNVALLKKCQFDRNADVTQFCLHSRETRTKSKQGQANAFFHLVSIPGDKTLKIFIVWVSSHKNNSLFYKSVGCQ